MKRRPKNRLNRQYHHRLRVVPSYLHGKEEHHYHRHHKVEHKLGYHHHPDDDDNLVYAQLYDAYGNDVLLFRVDKKGQLEAYGGIDGSSDSWDVVSKTYTTD